jgi:hypothetical protein
MWTPYRQIEKRNCRYRDSDSDCGCFYEGPFDYDSDWDCYGKFYCSFHAFCIKFVGSDAIIVSAHLSSVLRCGEKFVSV